MFKFLSVFHNFHERPLPSPVLLFVIDTVMIEEELTSLCSTLEQLFEILPQNLLETICLGKN